MSDGKRYVERFSRMKSERANWEQHWQDIAEFVLPNRDFTKAFTPGSERRSRIFNNTPGESLERLVGGINSLLTNQAQKWFDFGVHLYQPNNEDDRWLSRARDVVLDLLGDPSLNLYATLDECYESLAGFGTGVVFADTENGLRFRSVPLSGAFIDEDHMGVVDTVYRKFEYTLRQAIAAFGVENLPPEIQDKIRLNQDSAKFMSEKHNFIHCVGPREDYDMESLFATKMPWYSVVVHLDKKHIVKEGGFKRNPYMTPRWRRGSGEKYGRSPGMVLLQDIRYCNALSKASLSAAMKEADPPVQMPDSGFLKPAKLGPGGLNVYRSSSMGRIEPIPTGARSDRAYALIQEIENRIRAGFYNDMFQMPMNDRMTATEIVQRQQEQRGLFAPTLNRLYSELLDPLIFEAFDLAVSNGLLPEAPDGIRGSGLKIHYTSPLARAQRASELQSFMEWFAPVGAVAEADPTVLDNIHPDRLARRLAKSVSLPEELTRTDEELGMLRQERGQQQAQQQEMMAAQTAASAAKDGAQAISAMRG